ncbi:MAG: sigma-70 family RNA polymerase sigma factor [Proteobacteria bacterium]|nr:sigma-70 family RNA polymerase sigma factor [Pseudomonadota bacterium]
MTRLLHAAGAGEVGAADELLPLVYEELRRLARDRMTRETPGQTLQPTALVHEAYLRLVGSDDLAWDSRGHFFAAAAEAMRRILIERARHRGAEVHGGGRQRMSLEDIEPMTGALEDQNLIALDEALDALEKIDGRKAKIVKLRYFTGLTIAETALALGLSERTVKYDWRFARAWLQKEMRCDD